jgi:hypothetical protein
MSLIMLILKTDTKKVSEMLDTNSVFRWLLARGFNDHYSVTASVV